ncbi:MAG TPA: hypothetical protein ENN19_19070 [Chloroflexi bacterium]|nr:hypothetical protein [Chloroflexota bacterium]
MHTQPVIERKAHLIALAALLTLALVFHNGLALAQSATITGTIDTPAEGAIVSGTLIVEGQANDDVHGIERVEIWIDNTLEGNATYGAPTADSYHWETDSTLYADGAHDLAVKIYNTITETLTLTRAFSIDNAPQDLPTVSVYPVDLQLPEGGTGETEVRIDVMDASNLYGVEFEMTFDPALLQVVDADPSTDGVQIALGPLFPSDQHSVGINQVDNAAGHIIFGVTRRSPAPPLVDGVLARITWQATGAGECDLNFPYLKLSDTSGFEVAGATEGGSVSIVPVGQISGVTNVQGRTDNSGVQVCVSHSGDGFILDPPGACITTDAQGSFTLFAQGTVTIKASLAKYLNSQASVSVAPGEAVDLGTTLLHGGEITGDGCINIFDLVYIAARYRGTDLSADVNGDGQVDILDLSMTAANFGMCAPSAWTE